MLIHYISYVHFIHIEHSIVYAGVFVYGQGHSPTEPPVCLERDDCEYMDCAGMHGQDHECEDGLCVCLDHGVDSE